MSRQTVLLIDDEPDILELLEITLARMKIDTRTAHSVSEAKHWLEKEHFDLCLTDMRLPDGTGLELVKYVQQQHPQLPIAMITAYGSMDTAINALKAGAFDFLTKPVDLPRLRELVQSALRAVPKKSPDAGENPNCPLLGKSPQMQALRLQIGKISRSQAPVYIHGESGSGKELVAQQIHALGPRHDQPFIAVNCGAIPTELVESEFFGHRKGSFSGAFENKQGLFQAAHGGTLFLDEVADLPLAMQVKLLRAIQEKAVRSVGDQHETPVDIRILCATHKMLSAEVAEGRFRQDLYYRLNVIELQVPPLRERREDIPLLCEHLLRRLFPQAEMRPKLSNAALHALQAHTFPGNVRELENTLERAATLCENNLIETEDLHLNTSRCPTSAHMTELEQAGLRLEEVANLEDHLEAVEKDLIMQALEETRWNRTAAAERLGLSFRSMRYRLKKLGLD